MEPCTFLLGSSTLSDVDHSTHKFNEMAGRTQNRVTHDVNVPDGAIRMHDAVVPLPLCLLTDSRLDHFPEAGLVVGMNPLKEFFESGQTILWIETENTVAFVRPVPDILVWTPCPAACLAESLRFCQVRFTAPEGFLGSLALGDISHRPDKLAIAGCILQSVSDRVDVLDSPIRQQQTIGMFEISCLPRGTLDDLLKLSPVLRMDALRH